MADDGDRWASDPDAEPTAPDTESGTDPGAEPDVETRTGTDADPETETDPEADSFDDVAELDDLEGLDDVEGFDALEEPADFDDDFAELDDAFTEVELADIDDEALWDQVTADVEDEPAAGAVTDPSIGGVPPEETAGETAVVSKSRYCEQCPHFSAPPDATCSHEGTEIAELVDVDHVRVVDCPVVAARRPVAGDGATDDAETSDADD